MWISISNHPARIFLQLCLCTTANLIFIVVQKWSTHAKCEAAHTHRVLEVSRCVPHIYFRTVRRLPTERTQLLARAYGMSIYLVEIRISFILTTLHIDILRGDRATWWQGETHFTMEMWTKCCQSVFYIPNAMENHKWIIYTSDTHAMQCCHSEWALFSRDSSQNVGLFVVFHPSPYISTPTYIMYVFCCCCSFAIF